MKTSAQLRDQIEVALSSKNPAALSPRLRPEVVRVPCGVAEIDELLHGGLPVGVVVELVGAECSGRTTMALAYIAAITSAGSVCAWIDVADALDPESAAANGVDLERLLWVRCSSSCLSNPQTALQRPPEGPHGAPAALSVQTAFAARHTGGGSPHPRSEGRDMPEAVSALLVPHGGPDDRPSRREAKAIGTPGMANRPLSQRSVHREEQVNSDRLPPRRGHNLAIAPRCAEPQPKRPLQLPSKQRLPHEQTTTTPVFSTATSASKPLQALDQALRAADLLLQGGGFSTIVLDLGSTAPEIAWRIPLATWFRFRAACDRTRASLVLLTQHSCARSSAEIVVRLQAGAMQSEGRVMTGVRYRAATERSRTQPNGARIVPFRKPPQPERPGQRTGEAQWTSEAAWAQA